MSYGATRSVERPRFFNGQRLLASDLQAIEGFNREMRWLHNRSLHQPGIGNGFAVTGIKGDRDVVVGPGYGVDDLGREIVLTSLRTIPVQPVAGEVDGQPKHFVLTIQYPDDNDLEEVESREGLCGTRGTVRLRDEPIFCWVPLNPDGSPARDQAEILTGRRLVLVEVEVRDCKLDKDASIVQRRNARPPTQPYIAAGTEQPTAWAPWDPFGGGGAVDVGGVLQLPTLYQVIGGVQADIDTSGAGFLTKPSYFARIDGPRVVTLGGVALVIDGLLNIVDPSATGFTGQVLVLLFALGNAAALGEGPDGHDVASLVEEWEVGWVGVEG